MKIIVTALAGVTMVLGDPLYLQLIPVIVLSVVATTQLVVASFDLPHIYRFEGAESSKPVKWLLTFAIVATGVFGALPYEYLRACCTLDTWMWFFAFARIELMLGFLTGSMPLMFHQVFNDDETQGDTSEPLG